MKRLYILGSINTDLVIRTPYIPVSGETIKGSDFFIGRGGKGANQAVAAARSGAKVVMCGAVGDDSFGKEATESLVKEKIDCTHIKKITNFSSGVAVIILCNADNRIILDSGANALISKEEIDNFLNDATSNDIFLTQLENPIEIVGYALKKAKEKGLFTVLNPAPANTKITPYFKYVDLLIPNETECEILGGIDKIKSNIKTLIVTLGSKGFRIINSKIDQVFPCIKVNVIDTTAAGDTFCGAMLAALLEGRDLVEAAKFGSKSASIACTKKGAQPSIPTKEQVETW